MSSRSRMLRLVLRSLIVIGCLWVLPFALCINEGKVGAGPYNHQAPAYNMVPSAAPPTATVCGTPGTLDTSFNGTGKVTTPIGSSDESVNEVAIQPDGKMVVAGQTWNGADYDFALVRYNSDGTLDTSFNGTGKVVTAIGASFDVATSVALQPDGKIVAVGYSRVGGPVEVDVAVVRYNSNGTLDTSFNGTGIVTTSIGSSFDRAESVAIQPDGKIITAGSNGTTAGDFALVRYNSNGTLDTSFNGTGIVTTQLTTGDDVANAVAIQPDGRIVAGGYAALDFAAVRYNNNGTLDTSFNGTGMVTTPVGTGTDRANALALQSDGRIVLAGQSNGATQYDFAVVRYNTNGTLDTSFNGTGKLTTSFGPGEDILYSVAIQPDGRIVAVGEMWNGLNTDIAVARYNSNGALDTTFNGTGKVVTQIGVNADEGYSIAIQPDGRIVVAGTSFITGNRFEFAVVRYHAASCSGPPFDFDGDGKTDIGIFRPGPAEWWIQKSGDGSVFAAQFGATTDKIAPADFTGDGKADVTFWRPSDGYWYVLRSEDFSFYAFPFGANGDLPAPADYDADGKADAAVFRPSSATWFIQRSTGGTHIEQFGANGDVPIVGDYDNDGRADIAIFRPGPGEWWINRSTAGLLALQFGSTTDKPVQGDYTGDGKTDVAFWRPSNGTWYVLRSEDLSFFAVPFGVSTDIVAPGDYDGDGKHDTAVFRPSSATWFINRSTSGTLIQQFGANGDRPIPNAFVP